MPFKGINSVDFGHIAAEEEASNLQKYFIKTKEYEDVLSNHHKILVIGRKGSGKSAIYVALRDDLPRINKSVVVEALSLQDYPWETHKKIRDTGVPNNQSYIKSWKYIIWVIIAKRILNYSAPRKWRLTDYLWWSRLFNENTRYIYRFLKTNYGSIAPSFTEIIKHRFHKIKSISFLGIEIGGSDDEAQKPIDFIIDIINTLQCRIISLLSTKIEYFILFDQLDLGWDNSEETKQLMIGLILAARDIVRAVEQKNKKLHIIIFLRSDIYETLRFEDKNKLSSDVIELRWNDERLKNLASKRIEATANGTWEDVFTNDTMRQKSSQLSYITRRTMLRPRDMIQYCVFAKNKAIEANKNAINNDNIYDAERPYSEYMRKEIQDECNALEIKIDSLFGVIQGNQNTRITTEEFYQACRNKGIENIDRSLELLIELSVLGVHRAGGKQGGSRFVYKYQETFWDKLEPNVNLAVHPSLKHTLSLSEKRKPNRNEEQEDED